MILALGVGWGGLNHQNAVDAWLVRPNTAVNELRLVTPCMLRFFL